MPERAQLNILDELYLHLDREDEPWSVHLEVQAERRIDAARLADATRRAAALHPVARARLSDSSATDRRYHWEIADELAEAPLEVVECGDAAEVERAREQALGAVPSLDDAPPFALTLIQRPSGDSLILNIHHAAGDGIGALRLMGSILRAYA